MSTLDALRLLQHPLRALVTAIAVVALLAAFTGPWVLAAAVLAAWAGMVVAEVLAASRLRLPFLVTGLFIAGAAAWLSSRLLVGSGLLAGAVEPALALWASLVLSYAGASFALVGALRAVVARRPGWIGLEVAAATGAFAVAFASHRDGALARPLWLGDRAWRLGIDPADALVAVGAMFAVTVAALLVVGSKRRASLAGVLVLPLLAGLALLLVDPAKLQSDDEPHPLEQMWSDLDHRVPPTGARDHRDDAERKGGGEGDGERDGGGGKDEGEPQDGQGGGSAGGDPREGQDGGTSGGEPQDGGGQPQDGEGGGSGAGQPQDGEGGGGQGEGADGGGGQGEGGGSGGGDPQDGDGGSASEDGESGGQPQDGDGEGGGQDSPVAVVVLETDYEPPSEGWYLRQGALSEFDGHRLVESMREDVDQDVLHRFPTAREGTRPPPPVGRTPVRGRVSILTEHLAPFGVESPFVWEPVPNPNPARFVGSWRFESLAQSAPYPELFGRRAGDPSWSDEIRAHYLQIPDDPRYEALANEIVGALPPEHAHDPFARAVAVKLWLDREMKYSKNERHADADDPTADFLFGNRIGYCVHSSHASVYLWRTLGLPSRIGTGYLVQASDRRGDTLVVMGGDAHAWPELYLDGLGWVVLDVAPSENLDPTGEPLDEQLASLLSDMAREEPETSIRPNIDFAALRRAAAWTFGIGVAALVVVVTLVHWAAKAYRRARPLVAGSHALPRVAYRTALDRLAEVGLSREEGETRERFARRVGYPAFAAMTALHVAARFGDPKRPASGRPELSKAAWAAASRQLSREIGRDRPLWRRVLGLFDPFSMYRAR